MRMMKVKYKVVPNFVIRVQYLFIFNSLPVLFSDKISKALTLSRWGPELRIQGGETKTPGIHSLAICPQWKLGTL